MDASRRYETYQTADEDAVSPRISSHNLYSEAATELDMAMGNLDRRLRQLHERLEPALRPRPKEDRLLSTVDDRPSEGQLIDHLRGTARVAREYVDTIEGLLTRLVLPGEPIDL